MRVRKLGVGWGEVRGAGAGKSGSSVPVTPIGPGVVHALLGGGLSQVTAVFANEGPLN